MAKSRHSTPRSIQSKKSRCRSSEHSLTERRFYRTLSVVAEIRALHLAGFTQIRIAKAVGVSRATVRQILNSKEIRIVSKTTEERFQAIATEMLMGKILVAIGSELDREIEERHGTFAWFLAERFGMIPPSSPPTDFPSAWPIAIQQAAEQRKELIERLALQIDEHAHAFPALDNEGKEITNLTNQTGVLSQSE